MKTAIITGSASGIGLALTNCCLKKGMAVVMADKDTTALHAQAEQLIKKFPHCVFPITCDITQKDQVETLFQFTQNHLKQVDWLFNNAGIVGPLAPIWEIPTEQIQQVLQVNLLGMIQVINTFIPLLFAQNFSSHIINIASMYALCSGSQMAPYAMSKHAVLALSESLFYDLQRINKPVHVSVAFPSFTDTALLSQTEASPFQHTLNQLLSHSRPAMEVAEHIVQEVEQKRFYILPDKEVKAYCEDRNQAIIMQDAPHRNNIEKLFSSLLSRIS